MKGNLINWNEKVGIHVTKSNVLKMEKIPTASCLKWN